MNRLLPLLMAVALAVLGTVIYTATREKPQPRAYVAPGAQEPAPVVGGLTPRATGRPGDRDDPLETIETLAGLQERMSKQLEQEREANKKLKEELQESLKLQREELEQRLMEAVDSLRRSAQDASRSAADTAAKGVEAVGRAVDSNMPDGLGFDDLPIGGGSGRAGNPLLQQPSSSYVSITPLGGLQSSGSSAKTVTGGLLPNLLNPNRNAGNTPSETLDEIRSAKKAAAPRPRYTINDAATLYTNASMTALLGKVPIDQKLVNPYRFKLITGGDNLAASGLNLPPGIRNIVWTGYTVGNRELSCVSGYLDTVTLVFEDGTISTTTVKRNNHRESNTRKYLGYIADEWGKPCIRGELFSNANDYMKDRIALAALAAGADSVALGETSTVRNRDGDYQTILDGDVGRFVLGRSISGGLKEAVEYVRARMRDAYDVVYVGTGRRFAVHVEDQIEFDYDPKGRKLDHGTDEQETTIASFD